MEIVFHVAEIGFDTLVKSKANTDDTLALIVQTVNSYHLNPFVQEVAKRLCPAGTDKEACLRNIFDYYCRNVRYVLDQGGIEKVYTPLRTISEGEGDCKKAATFLASVLKAANIEPVLKHVHYADNDEWTHIYVIVPNPDYNHYITLDPTLDCKYNKEVNYKQGTLYFLNGKVMELRQMGNSGTFPLISWNNEVEMGCDSMMGDIEEIGNNVGALERMPGGVFHHHQAIDMLTKGHHGAVRKIFERIPIATQRGAFLDVIKNNLGGYASGLAVALGTKPELLNHFWHSLGGDVNELKKVIIEGAKVKPVALPEDMLMGPEYMSGFLDSIGNVFKKVVNVGATIIHSVAPILSVVPGVGPIISKVVGAAGGILQNITSKQPTAPTQEQVQAIVQSVPQDASGHVIPLPPPSFQPYIPQTAHGSFFSPVGFVFKSLMLISIYHLPPVWNDLLGTIAISAPLIYFGYKKFF